MYIHRWSDEGLAGGRDIDGVDIESFQRVLDESNINQRLLRLELLVLE